MRTGILHSTTSTQRWRHSAVACLWTAMNAMVVVGMAFQVPPVGAADSDDRIRHVTLDPQEATERSIIDVDVTAQDISLLVNLVLDDRHANIGITLVTDPGGVIVHETIFEDDSWDSTHFASDIVTEPVVGTGEVSLLLPTSPDVPLQTGRYRIAFEVDPPDARLHRVEHIARQLDDVESVDRMPQAIDLRIHVFEDRSVAHRDRLIGEIDTTWRDAIDSLLRPHAMMVGDMTVAFARRDSRQRLVALDDETEIEQACLEMRTSGSAFDSPAREPLYVGLVSAIPDAGHGGAYDGITGLSPQPGSPFDAASPNACLFIASRAWRDEVLDDELIAAMLSANLVHEFGHFAGLSHPSEADGVTFDLLDDTPICRRSDPSACTRAEGGGNVMFHSGGVEEHPYTLSKAQAWVLRRHPLLHSTARPVLP